MMRRARPLSDSWPRPPRPFALLAGLGALVLLAGGGPGAAQSRRFRETTEVVVVEVPVQVLRDGTPVRGLTVEDFEVLDGKKPQKIVGFDVVDLALSETTGGGRPTPVNEVPAAGRRHFLLFFDLSFSTPASIVKARSAVEQLVLEGLHPSDLVAVATYRASKGIRMVLGFTSDRDQIRLAIDTLGLVEPIEAARDPLGLLIGTPLGSETTLSASSGRTVGRGGVNTDAELDAALRDLSVATAREAREVRRNQVLALSSALGGLAQLMRSVDGRKYVVYLSEGFDSSTLLGNEGTSEASRRRIEEINRAASEGRYEAVDSDERFGNTSAQATLTAMLDEFKKADCTVQAVDIGGLRGESSVEGSAMQSGRRPRGESGLFILANETGGELYRNFNRLDVAMAKLLEHTSVTYVLAFEPARLVADGKYHRLKVRLKRKIPGARLVHRPGYFAPRPFSERSAMERQLATASLIVGGADGGEIPTALLAAPFDSGGGRGYVPVLVEIDGASLVAGAAGASVLPLEIYAYALDPGGTVRDFFTQALGLDLEKAGPALERSGFKFWGHLDLEPGRYTLRVLVRDGRSGSSGLATASVEVPAFATAEAVLLPPLFPEPAGKWLLGREKRDGQEQAPYPFVIGEQPFVPAARPVVRRGEPAAVCLMGYHLGSDLRGVQASLLTAGGEPVDGGRLVVEGAPETDASGRQRARAVFDATGLPAGQYRLRITLPDGEGGSGHTSSIALEVVG